MLTIKFKNITGLKPRCDYKVIVSIFEEVIYVGDVNKHLRKQGWMKLVEQFVEQNKDIIALIERRRSSQR